MHDAFASHSQVVILEFVIRHCEAMTDNHRSDNFDDELLSAYVDGELTSEQLALVEQRLAADPHAAQLVEELRAMSRELQALPAEVVGEDLRATIAQRAERAMLLGAEEQIAVVSRKTDSQRRLVWATFALAASLLLVAYLPSLQQEEQPLASAKPVQGSAMKDENREPLRLEAAAADEEQQPELEIAKQRTSLPISAGAMAKKDAMADRDLSKGQRFAAVGAKSVAESVAHVNDQWQLSCLVHITLSDEDTAGEQFAKLLVKNGISFREGENQPALSRATEVDSQADVEVDIEAAAAAQTEGLGPAARLQAAQSQVADDAQPKQFVLVEAQTERIEDVLEDCNADTFHCAAVRVTEQQLSGSSIDRFRQWERSGQQLAQSKLRALKRSALAAKQTTQGWATRLNANQYRAGKLNVDRKLLDHQSALSPSATQAPIQVLFILQQATAESSSTGEQAAPGR